MPEFREVAALFGPESMDALRKIAEERGCSIQEVTEQLLVDELELTTELPKTKGKVVPFGRGPAKGLKNDRQ